MKFTLYTKPIPVNQKYFVVHGRMILSSKYRDTKEAMEWEIKSAIKGKKPYTECVSLLIHFYYGDNRKRDIDAYLKILLDAMSEIVYEDDVQIKEMHVFKLVDKEDPRIEIELSPL